jgi:hypothetical protein
LLLITDLDKAKCASLLISNWMRAKSYPDNLVFRVAVREIEAWLLADHVGMGKLLVAGATNLPRDPDLLVDPKQVLLQLASKAPRVVQNDLLVEPGAIASQGLVTIREWAISFAIRGVGSKARGIGLWELMPGA